MQRRIGNVWQQTVALTMLFFASLTFFSFWGAMMLLGYVLDHPETGHGYAK